MTVPAPEEIFRQNEIFSELSDIEMAEIAMLSSVAVIPADTYIFRQGDPAPDMYLIHEGRIDLTAQLPDGRNVVISELGPGACFGEISLFDDGPRAVSARTRDDAVLVRLTAQIFDLIRIVRRPGYVNLLRHFAAWAADNLQLANTEVRPAGTALAEQEISALPKYSRAQRKKYARVEKDGRLDIENISQLPIFAGFSRQNLADLIGKSRCVKVPKGQLLFLQGEAAEACYIVVSGAVQVVYSFEHEGVMRHSKVALLTPGRPIGHLAMFEDEPRSASAYTREQTLLIEISRAMFDDLLKAGSEVAFGLLDVLLNDLAFSLRVMNRRLLWFLSQKELRGAARTGAA